MIWSTLGTNEGRWALHHFVLQMQICPHPSYFWHTSSLCSLLCSKIMDCGSNSHNTITSLQIVAKVDCPLYFDAKPSPRLSLRAFFHSVWTSHVSNVPSQTSSSIISLASSWRRWSSTRTRLAYSWAESWQCIPPTWVHPNTQA